MKYNDYAIKQLLNRLSELFNKKSTPKKTAGLALEAIEVIRQLQKSDKPDSQTGYWEWYENTICNINAHEWEYGWRCSKCHSEPSDEYDDPGVPPNFPYCPFCGTRMDEKISKAQADAYIATLEKQYGENADLERIDFI